MLTRRRLQKLTRPKGAPYNAWALNLPRALLAAAALLTVTGCPKRVEPGAESRGPRHFQLLPAAAEQETTLWANKRQDVEIDTRDFERTPRVVALGESPLFRLEGSQARLFGDAAGTLGWSVDNFVLIEVLAENGKVLHRAAVGFTEPVSIGAERIDNLGKMSFTFEAGEVNLTPLLPESEPFKLRATALDYYGVGKVTDLFLVLDAPSGAREEGDLRGQ
jgi:hypothetical protein